MSDRNPAIDVRHDALGSEKVLESRIFEGEHWIDFHREFESFGLEPRVDTVDHDYEMLRMEGIEVFAITVEYDDGTVGYCEVENNQEAGTYEVVTAVDPR